MSLTRGNEKATYSETQGVFIGSKQLIYFLNAYMRVNSGIGNNPFYWITKNADIFNLTITEYEPDVYPEGTLDR